MRKDSYHHGELRAALLDAAEALVRERGTEGWSLREASARVGVSPSAAYHHFASRDALVATLAARILTQLGERLETAAREAGLAGYAREYVRWAVDSPALARLTFGGGYEGTISPHPHDVLAAELDNLTEAGELPRKVRPGAEFVVSAAVHGMASLIIDGLMHLDDADVGREADRVVGAALTGLRHETTPRNGWPKPRSQHLERLAAQGKS